jgi:methionyl-tRNA synthetase
MLKAHGEFILPDQVAANEFMNLAGEKISTSRNHAVWLNEYLEKFKDKQDVLRYVLTTNAPESKDGDFTWKDLQAKNNNELVATLGNFIHRTMVLIHKFFDGLVPPLGPLTETDRALIAYRQEAPNRIGEAIERLKFKEALHEWMGLAKAGNKYLTDTAPWHLIKEAPIQAQTILNICLQLAAQLAILGEPFMPFTSHRLAQLLNLTALDWERAQKLDLLQAGAPLGQPQLLFERIEDKMLDL